MFCRRKAASLPSNSPRTMVRHLPYFFACLSWITLNLSTRLLNGTIQSRESLFIFQAVKSRAVCTVLFILHEHTDIYFFKIFLLDMIYIAFFVKYMPPPIKSALPCDRAENFRAGHLLDASGGRTIFSDRSFISRQR